jgi:hypothetical protein
MSAVPTARLAAAVALWLLASVVWYALVPHPAYFDRRYGITSFHDGTAHNPFARRALAPALIEAGMALLPDALRGRIDARLAPITSARGGRLEHGSVIAVSACLTIVSLVAFLALLAAGFAALGVGATPATWLATLAVPLLHVFTNFSVFAYDQLVLALFAAATLRLWRRGARDRGFDALVAVAALAKETAVLLPLAALAVDDAPLSRRLGRFAARAGVVAAIQAALAWSVADRPGELVEMHLADNLRVVSQLSSWLVFEPFEHTVAFPGGLPIARPVGLNLLVWLPLVALAVHGGRSEPRLARALLAMALPLVALQFSFGVFNEIRNFYELLPALLWLACAGALRRSAASRASASAANGAASG